MQGVAVERRRGRGVEGQSGGWDKRRRGIMGDGGETYYYVLLESGGYHGDQGATERDGS